MVDGGAYGVEVAEEVVRDLWWWWWLRWVFWLEERGGFREMVEREDVCCNHGY